VERLRGVVGVALDIIVLLELRDDFARLRSARRVDDPRAAARGPITPGVAPFRVAELPRDQELLRLARRDALAWISRSPELAQPDEALLRKRLMKLHGAALDLADIA